MRAEPRSMTLADAMGLAAGVAVSFSSRPLVGAFPYAMPPSWVLLVVVVAWVLWIGCTAVGVAVAARLVRYRRMPRPAEWLVLVTSLAGIHLMGTGDMAMALFPWERFTDLGSIATWRWIVAGFLLGVVAIGLGLLRLGRSTLPAWAKSMALAVLAFVSLAGPIQVFGAQGADLFAPSDGFGAGSPSLLFWLACQLVAATPIALYFGVPAMAALVDRLRRTPWRWTEWAGVALPTAIALTASPLYQGNFRTLSPWWAAERLLVAAWLAGVGLLSWLIVARLGPAWSRWIGDQAHRGSMSIDASPASTR